MPEYDAFGREIGENTLAGLGGDSQRADPVAGAAETAPERTAPASAPPVPPRFERRGRRIPRPVGCLLSLIVVGVVIGIPAIVAIGLFSAAENAVDDVTATLDAAPGVPGTAPPAGIEGDSLIAPGNLAPALDRLGRDGSRAAQVVVRPDRIDAELLEGRRGRLVQLAADGTVVRSDPRRLGADPRAVALEALDPRAPGRLVRRSAARFEVRPRAIDYLIASPDPIDPGAHHWVAYFKNGIYVRGDAAGRIVRRID